MKKVIFWDFDGTLAYPNTSFGESLTRALEECGYEIAADGIYAFLKSACSWNNPDTPYPDAVGEGWWSALLLKTASFCAQNGIPADDAQKICQSFRRLVIDYDYRIYQDAHEILSYCRDRGYTSYVISNNFPELTEVAKRYGLDEYFAGYILSSNVGYEKPRPEIFRAALELAGETEICYMIGDNPASDIAGGNSAGMRTVLVHNKKARRTKPAYICRELIEIRDIVK